MKQTIRNIILFSVLALVGVTEGCTSKTTGVPSPLRDKNAAREDLAQGQGGPGSRRSGDSLEVPANDTKPTRPSEDGEGIPGYFVDPNMVSVREASDGDLRVSAPAGALKAQDGNPAALKVHVMEIGVVDQTTVVKSAEGYTLTDATLVEEIFPNADGSFEEDFDNQRDKVIVIRLNQNANDATVKVSNSSQYGTAIFRDLKEEMGVFQVLTPTELFNRYPDVAQ